MQDLLDLLCWLSPLFFYYWNFFLKCITERMMRMNGKCPNCAEVKEITRQGQSSGMCDDCYKQKYTCFVCDEMCTHAWTTDHIDGKGNAHRECLELKSYVTTE